MVAFSFHGVPVFKGGQLGDVEWDGILIADDVEAAEARLAALCVPDERIWRLS